MDTNSDPLIVAAAFLLALTLAAGALYHEFGPRERGRSSSSAGSLAAGTPIRTSEVAGVATHPGPSAAAADPKELRVEPESTPVDRRDCTELRLSHLRTRGERQWFVDNCMFLTKRANASSADPRQALLAAGYSLEPHAENRSATGVGTSPPVWLSPQNATGIATDWLMSNSPVQITIGPAECTPIWINGHWVVTCNVTLAGCSGSYCAASLSVCVFSEEPVVVPDAYC
jgi:hypothetical protein